MFSVQQLLDPDYVVPIGDLDTDEYKALLVNNLRTAWTDAFERSQKANEKMRTQYDKTVRSNQIQPGDKVLLKETQVRPGMVRKFHLPWARQFRVIEVKEPWTNSWFYCPSRRHLLSPAPLEPASQSSTGSLCTANLVATS